MAKETDDEYRKRIVREEKFKRMRMSEPLPIPIRVQIIDVPNIKLEWINDALIISKIKTVAYKRRF